MDKDNKKAASGNNPEDQEEVVTEETQEKETSALDEVLKDPELKAEYDARIQEAVAAALSEQDEEEAEPPADDQRELDLDAREKSLRERELKATAIEELAKEQLPSALADCFNYESEEAYKLTKEKVVKAFQDSLKEAVNARLRSRPPQSSAAGARNPNTKKNVFADEISKYKARR